MEFRLSDYQKHVLIAKDKITGFTGKIVGHADYITRCDQYLIQPDAKDGGEWRDSKWFDQGRLEVASLVPNLEVGDIIDEENGADSPAPIK